MKQDQVDDAKYNDQENEPLQLPFSKSHVVSSQTAALFQGTNMTLGQDASSMFKLDPSAFINEDTQMCMATGTVEANGPMESPFDFTSPCYEPGDISSPYEAMESDGLNDPDDPQCPRNIRRSMWTSGHFSTTTPRDSSDDDNNYESSGSRKKRRRTKKEMHPSDNFLYSHGSHISSPVCGAEMTNGNEQNTFPNFSLALSKGTPHMVNSSDSNLYATFMKNKRRNSNASESNQSSISTRYLYF